jgi:hypothetical protein
MKEEIIKKIKNKLTIGTFDILNGYTNIALIIHANGIALEKYKNSNSNIRLLTTNNIPLDCRLNIEIENSLGKNELIDKYENQILNQILESYVINSVSLTDAIFEEIYEILLNEYEPTLSSQTIDSKLKSAWSNYNLINYYVDKTNIQDSTKEHLKIKETFYRYLEYRIVRNSIVHTKGVFSSKHINLIDNLYEKFDTSDKIKSIKNTPFYHNKKVELDIYTILQIRKYLFNTLNYFILAFK